MNVHQPQRDPLLHRKRHRVVYHQTHRIVLRRIDRPKASRLWMGGIVESGRILNRQHHRVLPNPFDRRFHMGPQQRVQVHLLILEQPIRSRGLRLRPVTGLRHRGSRLRKEVSRHGKHPFPQTSIGQVHPTELFLHPVRRAFHSRPRTQGRHRRFLTQHRLPVPPQRIHIDVLRPRRLLPIRIGHRKPRRLTYWNPVRSPIARSGEVLRVHERLHQHRLILITRLPVLPKPTHTQTQHMRGKIPNLYRRQN